MNKRVVITGLGVVSSIGIGKDAFWEALLQGKSGISPVTAFDTTNHFTHNGGEVKIFKASQFIPEERLQFMNRATQMALASARLALDDAALTPQYLAGLTVGVSLLLVAALLVTPAAAAYLLARRLPAMMLLSAGFGALSSLVGLYASFYLNIASGAAIVLAATIIFLLAFFFAPQRGLLARKNIRSYTSE